MTYERQSEIERDSCPTDGESALNAGLGVNFEKGIDMTERARIGVDGNAGYALLGENIQSGECEFIEVPLEHVTPNALRWAAKQALAKLRARLNMPALCWYAEEDYWGANFEPRIT